MLELVLGPCAHDFSLLSQATIEILVGCAQVYLNLMIIYNLEFDCRNKQNILQLLEHLGSGNTTYI